MPDEQLRGAEDRQQGQHGLHAGPEEGRVGIFRAQLERLQLEPVVLILVPHLAPQIHGVGQQEGDTQQRLDGEGDQAQRDLEDEDHQEPGLVAPQTLAIEGEDGGAGAPAAGEDAQPDHGIGDGGQHQRAAERGADADILGRRVMAEGHRHQGDHALRQGGAEGGEDRADRGLADAGLAPDPFHAVDEIFAGDIDRAGGEEQEGDGRQHRNIHWLSLRAGRVYQQHEPSSSPGPGSCHWSRRGLRLVHHDLRVKYVDAPAPGDPGTGYSPKTRSV